jgi:hypothetical protein
LKSFFCVVAKANDWALVNVFSILFGWALWPVAHNVFGWEDDECFTGESLPSVPFFSLLISESGVVVACFVGLVIFSLFANSRLRLWKEAMVPRNPLLFIDILNKLETFRKLD